MATNEFLSFCQTDTGTNLLTNAEYLADAQRDIGNQPGIARAKLVNKAIRQSAAITHTLAQFISDTLNANVEDDGDLAALLLQMQTAFGTFGVPTGATLPYFSATAPSGFILCDGTTIGSAASGATGRANADTANLYTLLWQNINNTNLPIQDSSGTPTTRGLNAAADFSANKRLPIPDLRQMFLRGTNAGTKAIGGVTYPAVTMGAVVQDTMQGHIHVTNLVTKDSPSGNTSVQQTAGGGFLTSYNYNSGAPSSDGSNGTPRTGIETVPLHMGINYIIKL